MKKIQNAKKWEKSQKVKKKFQNAEKRERKKLEN